MRRPILQAIILGVLGLAVVLAPVGREALAGARTRQAQQQGQQQQAPPQQLPGGAQITVSAQLVTVDAVITDSDGNFLSGLKKENFRILEDGKPQIISDFSPAGEAPITIVMLLEFRANMFTGNYEAMLARYWAPEFLRNLKKTDWIALMDYDLKTRVDVDFTHDPNAVLQELQHMVVPLFSEACMFDAVAETLDRLRDVHGKKAILLIATGYDTFSKHTLDATLKIVRQSDVSIFSICLGQRFLNAAASMGNVDSAQAFNQMRAFSELTGGQAWNPNFDGEVPGIMRSVAMSLRNQYSLGYNPAPRSLDGKYHKIKVELVNADGSPYVFVDQKGKKKKLVVYARQGYTAKTASAAN
jgi:Ca-activated chloride channel family protein